MTDSLLLALATLTQGRWIDLTHAFTAGIPHYVAFPDEQREVVCTIEQHGFLVHRYGHVGQWGTHVDPPSHFIAGGRCLDELAVEDMLLPLVVLDGSARVEQDADFVVDVAFIQQHEQRHGRIPDGAFVAFASGWSRRWPSSERMQNRDAHGVAHYPGWGASRWPARASRPAVSPSSRRASAVASDTSQPPGLTTSRRPAILPR